MRQFQVFLKMAMTLLVLLGTALAGWCHDFEVDGIYYNYNGDGTSVSVTSKDEVYGWLVYKDVVTVPDEVTYNGMTYTVTAVGQKAFYSCPSLTRVILPSTVTVIGDNAFARNTNLLLVNIPDAVVKIGESAFTGDSRLMSVALGPNVTSIGNNAFNGCSKLEVMTVDPLNPVYDSRDNCNAIIEKTTNTLLFGCKNTVIPSTVTSVGSRAFALGAAPASLDIPASVTSIGESAFFYCSGLTELTLNEGLRDIDDKAFSSCHSLTSLVLPSTLTAIGSEAFAGCWNLTSIAVDELNPVFDSRNDCNAIIESANTGQVVEVS